MQITVLVTLVPESLILVIVFVLLLVLPRPAPPPPLLPLLLLALVALLSRALRLCAVVCPSLIAVSICYSQIFLTARLQVSDAVTCSRR